MHRLSIKPTEAPDRLFGVKQKKPMSTHGRMNHTVLPKSRNNFKVSCVVFENITDHENQNTQNAATDLWKVRNYNIADPVFDKPSTIELLLGLSVYTHCEVTECQGRNYTANRHDPWSDNLRCR